MSLQSVAIEGTPLQESGQIRYLQLSAQAAAHGLEHEWLRVVSTHYGREFADATVYQVVNGWSLEGLLVMLGESADTEIKVFELSAPTGQPAA